MIDQLDHSMNRQEAGTSVPASFVINTVTPRKESLMSKLGYFFAGVVAGATALTAAAFLVDDVADKLEAASDSDDDSDDGESSDYADDAEAAGETVNPAS